MGIDHLLLFVAAGLLLNLTPGPDVLYIVTHALRDGARAGVVAALGITAGCFVHIIAAAIGVSALLAASTMAFTALKWLGAAYLVYVGLRLLLARQPREGDSSAIDFVAHSAHYSGAAALKGIFFQGFWTNALNPKVALFFLAFVIFWGQSPNFLSQRLTLRVRRMASQKNWCLTPINQTRRWRFCCSACCSISTACGSISAGRLPPPGWPGASARCSAACIGWRALQASCSWVLA